MIQDITVNINIEKRIKGANNMKELTEFEKQALEEIKELSNHVASEITRLVDSVTYTWQSFCYDTMPKILKKEK